MLLSIYYCPEFESSKRPSVLIRIHNRCKNIPLLTYLTVGTQVSGAGAIAYVAVPTFFTQTCVATGGATTPLLQFTGAETADAECALDLGQTADIAALAIDEEVADAAYVAIV